MPDDPFDDPADDLPALTPADSERVRRLLAAARHTEPVPDEVAARLDRTLAELSAQDRELRHRPVVTLESRRRRRRATRLLVAAAAVVAVGIGAGPVLSGLDVGSGENAGAGGSSESTADRQTGAAGGDSTSEEAPAPAESPGDAAADADGEHPGGTKALPRVGGATFESDAEAVRASGVLGSGADVGSLRLDRCGEGSGPGQRAVVLYDGRPAVLVYRAPTADGQRVDLVRCRGGAVLRSAVLPAP